MAVLGWGGTVLIARSLSLHQFGRFTLIFTLLGLMSVVTDMGIGRIAVRGMLGQAEHDASHFASSYITLRSILGLVGYGLVLLIGLLLGFSGDMLAATAVAGVVVVLATPSAALDVVFQSRLTLGTVSVAGVIGLTAQFALTAALAAAGGTLLLFVIPAVLCEVVILAWKIPRAHRLVPLRFAVDRAIWVQLLREAVPLTLGYGLATVYYRVDAVMLSRLDTFESVGIYGVSYKFVDILHFAATAVTVPLLTVLVRSWPGDMPAFRDAVRRSAMLVGLIGGFASVGLIGFPGPITTLLYGKDYAVGQHATQVLIVAQVLTLFSSLALTCLVSVERHRIYPLVMLVGLVLNISANLVLIPRLSYEGAAAATLGSEVVVLTLLLVLLSRVTEIRPLDLRRLVVVPVALGLALAAGWTVDLALPWVLAATVATIVFVAVALLGGVVAAAGIPVPARLGGPRRDPAGAPAETRVDAVDPGAATPPDPAKDTAP
jgi:O-antigen/teichoic acid export membrane protein